MEKYFVKKLENKLMLCSRDIQVGDEYYFNGIKYKAEVQKMIPSIPKGAYKIVGEISPGAVWVKESDEFDEEDIKRDILVKDTFDNDYIHYHPKGGDNFVVKGSTEEVIKEFPIKIKCPTCGTFH